MTISAAVRGTPLNDGVDNTVFTMVDAGTPTASRLLLAFVTSRSAGDSLAADTFTGYGLTWTSLGGHDRDSGNVHMEVYGALTGGSPTSVDPVATWSLTRSGCHIHIVEITLTNYGATPADCVADQGGGVRLAKSSVTGTATSISFTLVSASNSANRPIAHASHGGAVEVTDPATNWTELTDGSMTSPINNVETQWRSDVFDTAVSASWVTAANRFGVALELIDTQPVGGSSGTDPFGMTGFFGS